jgi:hypothetical protein
VYNRTRSNDSTNRSTNIPFAITRKNASPTTGLVNGPYRNEKSEMLDNVTPGWKALINSGKVINKPMNRTTLKFSGGGSGFAMYDSNPLSMIGDGGALTIDYGYALGNLAYLPGIHRDTNFPTNPIAGGGWASEYIDADPLIKEASTKALAGIKRPDVQGQVLLLELRKTLDTLRNPVKAIADAITREKRRAQSRGKSGILKSDAGVGKNVARGASDQFLSVYYGILPIMYDVEGIMKALHRRMQSRFTSRATASDQTVFSPESATTSGSSIVQMGTVLSGEEKLMVRAGSLYEILADHPFSYLGLGLENVPATMWEVTPYSFVLDWLTNIGDVISALTPVCGVNRRAEWIVTDRTMKSRMTVVNTTNAPGASNWKVSRPCSDWQEVEKRTYNRMPADLGGHVGFVWKPKLSHYQSAAAIALAIQQITKH